MKLWVELVMTTTMITRFSLIETRKRKRWLARNTIGIPVSWSPLELVFNTIYKTTKSKSETSGQRGKLDQIAQSKPNREALAKKTGPSHMLLSRRRGTVWSKKFAIHQLKRWVEENLKPRLNIRPKAALVLSFTPSNLIDTKRMMILSWIQWEKMSLQVWFQLD